MSMKKCMESRRCIDNMYNLIFRGPTTIHPESDIKSRVSISTRQQLRAIYPECFTGIGTFMNYKYYIVLYKNAKPVVHLSEEDCTSTKSLTR